MNTEQAHWQQRYSEREPTTLSWYEPRPSISLELIGEAGLSHDAAILDAGGGTSRLAAELVAAGYRDVTVADISAAALARLGGELGAAAEAVTLEVADLRGHRFAHPVDLWHDRAVFHFMVEEQDREGYLATLARTLRPGGHLVLATFGPQGPTSCSGLPVQRYDTQQVSEVLGAEFELLRSRIADHHTPSGAVQQFTYGHWQRRTES